MITFGPVPSRRLGQGLGVNNIPPKACKYSCAYCQLGRTKKMEAKFRPFYDPNDIQKSVAPKIDLVEKAGESIDYVTFVPDGEPSLDINLGNEIERLRGTGKKIAVITNSSLVWHERVKEALKKADWVSVKVDSVQKDIWRKINRPHRSLELEKILNGIIDFAREFQGKLVTETMLVRNLNDKEEHIKKLAQFMNRLSPDIVYLSVPIRPPAEKWVLPPTEETLIRAYHLLNTEVKNVEYLIGYEGKAFAFTGDVDKDLLDITAVHPMREEAVTEFLKKAKAEWSAVDQLIKKGLMVKKNFQSKTFYTRKLFAPQNNEILNHE